MPHFRFNKCLALTSLILATNSPAQEVPLVQALDAPDLTWSTSGDVPFKGTTFQDAWQGSHAQATLTNGETARLTATIPGPGIVDFWIWALPLDTLPLSDFSATLDGVALDLSSGSWPYGFLVEGEGTHTLELSVTSSSSETVDAIVDAAVFAPEVSVSLTEALDEEGRVWTTSGDGNWSGVSYLSLDGEDIARSEPMEDGETSSLHTTVEGPGEISFWWQRSTGSQTSGSFFINDTRIHDANIAGRDFWKKVTYTLGPGTHQLRWDAQSHGTPDPLFPAEGIWIDQFQLAAPEEVILAAFAPPLPGANVGGRIITAEPGFNDASALAVIVDPGEEVYLRWPLAPAPDDRLRRLSFQTKGTGHGTISSNSISKRWNPTQDWQKIEILIPPFMSEFSMEVVTEFGATSLAVIALDDLKIEVVETQNAAPFLGPDGDLFTTTAWYGLPNDDGEIKATSIATGSILSAEIEGPAWLSFETDLVNSGLALEVDSRHVLAITDENSDDVHRYLIPPGSRTVNILHLRTSSFFPHKPELRAIVSNLSVEPIPTVTIPTALNTPDREWDISSSLDDKDSNPPIPSANPLIFGTNEGELLASITEHQSLNLKTTITGPALVSYHWKIEEVYTSPPSEGILTGWQWVGGGGFPPGQFGTQLLVNNSRITWLIAPWDQPFFSAPVAEPMNPSAPHLVSYEDYEELVVQALRSHKEEWTQDTIYLGPGEHDLNWISETYDHAYQWQTFSFRDFTVTPIGDEYGQWAAQTWTTTSEENAAIIGLHAWQNPLADPDQDGVNNAAEFALKSNPRNGSSVPQAAVIISKDALWKTLTAPLEGIATIPMISEDLITWRPAPHTFSEEGLRASSDSPTPKKTFFQLRIDIPTSD